MWHRANTANQKFKQNAQTQDADGMQALSLLYDTVRGCNSTIICFIGGGGGLWALCHLPLSPPPPVFAGTPATWHTADYQENRLKSTVAGIL